MPKPEARESMTKLFFRICEAHFHANSDSFPVTDIHTLGFAAISIVCASGPKIKPGGMTEAGVPVLVGVSPRIVSELLDVRSAPLLFVACRRFHQHLQPFISRG